MLAKRILENRSKQLTFQPVRANVFVVKCGGVHQTANHQTCSTHFVARCLGLLQ